jgi:hypothetical protein
LPTKVVTLWAARLAEKRPLERATDACWARLSLAEVTQGVSWAGAVVPEMTTDADWAPVLLLMAWWWKESAGG